MQIYWAGPILGGLAGTFVYTQLFAADPNTKAYEKSCQDVEFTVK